MRSQLNECKRELTKLQQEAADKVVRYRLKNGLIASLKGTESDAFQAWVYNNASPDYRASDGSKLHVLTMMVNNTSDMPYESWDSFQARGGDLLIDEFAGVESDNGISQMQ